MKIVLAPTDFSKTARNASNYAAEIAKRTKRKLVLLHAFHPTVIITETPIELPLLVDIEKECLKRLKKLRYNLITRHGHNLHVEIVCLNGLAADVIDQYTKTSKADLIVVGTHGAGFVEEKLLGSITSELIKNSTIPVLSIAAHVKFRSIKKIVIATDREQLEQKNTLDPLIEIATLYKSHIYVLNVTEKESNLPYTREAIQGLRFDHLFEICRHSFHAVANKNVVKGINAFTEEYQVDLIVMMPRQHNFLQSIIKKSNTRAMAFHTQTPLLTIHI